jgi:Amidohydrolase family
MTARPRPDACKAGSAACRVWCSGGLRGIDTSPKGSSLAVDAERRAPAPPAMVGVQRHVRRVSRELETARADDAEDQFAVSFLGWVAPWTFVWARPWTMRTFMGKGVLLAALRQGQRNVLRLHRAGVPIVVGTDAPSPWPDAIYHFHGPQTAREVALLTEAGMTPLQAIASATSVPARMLGLASESGTVAVGKRADLLVVADDPATDVRALRDVRWTIKDGVAHTPAEWMAAGRPSP